ncbi:HEAT repeat domain-containing protein [Aliamphritea spongicola]|nr:HEAT repeat domain-containing protein [Aliamphritea spongicola]
MSIAVRDQFNQVLNHLLTQGDEADRCYAAKAAGQSGAHNSLQALLDNLYHEDIDVCVDAAEALGNLKPTTDTEDLISRLIAVVEQHPEGDAKAAAANALARLDQPAALAALLSWAKGNPTANDFVEEWDDWWDIQLNAINALGRLGHSDAVPVLLNVLEEEPLDIEADILRALSCCGEPGISAVIELSRSNQPRIVRRSMNALGQCDCDASLIAIFKGLRHDQPDVRSHAAQAIGQRQAMKYFIDLLYLLKDQDADVRQQALNAAQTMLPQLQPYHSKHLTPEKFTELHQQLDARGRGLILNALDQLISQTRLHEDTQDQSSLESAVRESLNSADGEEIEAAVQLLHKVRISDAQQRILERIEETGLPLTTRRNLVSALAHLSNNPQNCLIP